MIENLSFVITRTLENTLNVNKAISILHNIYNKTHDTLKLAEQNEYNLISNNSNEGKLLIDAFVEIGRHIKKIVQINNENAAKLRKPLKYNLQHYVDSLLESQNE